MRFVLAAGAAAFLCACAAEPLIEPSPVLVTPGEATWEPAAAGGLRLVVRGDWDDVDTSASVGVSRAEVAVVGPPIAEQPDRRVYPLLSILDERGTLTARRLPEQDRAGLPGPGEPIEFTCRFAPGRSPGRVRTILIETSRRLRDLAGADYRPIR